MALRHNENTKSMLRMEMDRDQRGAVVIGRSRIVSLTVETSCRVTFGSTLTSEILPRRLVQEFKYLQIRPAYFRPGVCWTRLRLFQYGQGTGR